MPTLKCNMVEVMVFRTMNVSYMPPPGLRRIRVGGLALHLVWLVILNRHLCLSGDMCLEVGIRTCTKKLCV